MQKRNRPGYIDSSTKSVGKVKLLGIPPNERRKPSKFLLGERSHSRLNRENSRLGAGGMRPVPASPLAASNGVTSAPTTPVSNQAPQTLALPSPLSTLFSPQPGKFTSGIPNKEVMSAPSSPAMSPAASSLLSSSATISPPTSPILGHPPAPHPPESPVVAHTPASPTLTSIPKPIPALPTVAQTPASPTLTSTPKPISALPTAVQTSSPAIQPKTPTFQATTSQPVTPVTPITTPSSPRATEPASPRGTSATSPPTSDQLGRLNETKLEILKQLKTLDLQPLEKKHPASPPPKEEPKEDRDANGEDGEDRPNKKNQNRKRDVGTIRNMNEQQFRETVRTQLESQLEALETQIKVLQNDHSAAPAQENAAHAAQATSPTQRRLTPPPNVSYESPQPRFSLQPVRAVVKPQEDLPEAIQALMRIKSAGSRESAILLLPTPTSPTHLEEADAAPAAAPASERSPQNRLERMSTSYVQTTSSEKDDVLGYGKMTQRGIRKHINMLDRSKLEAYLSDDEFTRVLGFNRTDYAALPKWKQERLKRERGLLNKWKEKREEKEKDDDPTDCDSRGKDKERGVTGRRRSKEEQMEHSPPHSILEMLLRDRELFASFLDQPSILALSTVNASAFDKFKSHISQNHWFFCDEDLKPSFFKHHQPKMLKFKSRKVQLSHLPPFPPHVTHLFVFIGLQGPLLTSSNLPPNLTHLIFNRESTYDTKVDSLPPSLLHLTFGIAFNKPVEHLPPSLTHLTFGGQFNQHVGNLPSSLTHLAFGLRFNNPVDKLPPKLRHLSFGYDFDHPVDHLPSSLSHLSFSFKFNHPLNHLPPNLSHLTIESYYFNQPLDALPLSLSLFHLLNSNIKTKFAHNLDNLPDSVKDLLLEVHKDFPIQKLPRDLQTFSALPNIVEEVQPLLLLYERIVTIK